MENYSTLLDTLIKNTDENEFVEFKLNFHSPEEIGERISALSNGATLKEETFGYLIFGIEDKTREIKGTTFKPKEKKVGNDELENWLAQRITPRIDFKIIEFEHNNKIKIVIFEIPASKNQPTTFLQQSYIRIGSFTRKLRDFPDKEKKLWNEKKQFNFEKKIALKNLSKDEIISLLDTSSYFDSLNLPYPTTRELVLEKFASESFIKENSTGKFTITNLGAILFAKDMNQFPSVSRKSIRVIVYNGKNRIETVREHEGTRGYAIGFKNLVNWINSQLPSNEEIGKVFRQEVKMYPEIAIRELVANTLIHQDFSITGTGPIIEIFSDRIEFTNPGQALINTERFIDDFQSRNENVASFMRRIGICEEKGSGIDKVIFNIELFQLPAPNFQSMEKHIKVTLYSKLELREMDSKDKIRACYQHSCLCYVSNEKMSNQSLRKRFMIDSKNSSIVSRIIKDSLNAGVIKEDDPESNSRKFKKYSPYWA